MAKKGKKRKPQAKPNAAKSGSTTEQQPVEYPRDPPAISRAEAVREPTEAEVVALMHDDDLLEYSSSSPSDLRRNSMFEFYKQQWKAARAAGERSKKVEALRKAFNPNSKPRIGLIAKLREASKVGTVYMSDR